jgi:hypothetical protein
MPISLPSGTTACAHSIPYYRAMRLLHEHFDTDPEALSGKPGKPPPSIITKSIIISFQATYDSLTLYPNFGQRRVWGAIFSESRNWAELG